jgi:hypothetical protein
MKSFTPDMQRRLKIKMKALPIIKKLPMNSIWEKIEEKIGRRIARKISKMYSLKSKP